MFKRGVTEIKRSENWNGGRMRKTNEEGRQPQTRKSSRKLCVLLVMHRRGRNRGGSEGSLIRAGRWLILDFTWLLSKPQKDPIYTV